MKRLLSRHNEMRGSRRRFFTLYAVSRVEIMIRPSPSTTAVTGESCGRPSDRIVDMTAWLFCSRNALASSTFMPSSLARSPTGEGADHFVLQPAEVAVERICRRELIARIELG